MASPYLVRLLHAPDRHPGGAVLGEFRAARAELSPQRLLHEAAVAWAAATGAAAPPLLLHYPHDGDNVSVVYDEDIKPMLEHFEKLAETKGGHGAQPAESAVPLQQKVGGWGLLSSMSMEDSLVFVEHPKCVIELDVSPQDHNTRIEPGTKLREDYAMSPVDEHSPAAIHSTPDKATRLQSPSPLHNAAAETEHAHARIGDAHSNGWIGAQQSELQQFKGRDDVQALYHTDKTMFTYIRRPLPIVGGVLVLVLAVLIPLWLWSSITPAASAWKPLVPGPCSSVAECTRLLEHRDMVHLQRASKLQRELRHRVHYEAELVRELQHLHQSPLVRIGDTFSSGAQHASELLQQGISDLVSWQQELLEWLDKTSREEFKRHDENMEDKWKPAFWEALAQAGDQISTNLGNGVDYFIRQ